MSDLRAYCDECGNIWPIDRFQVGGAVCFKCRVRSVQFARGDLKPNHLYKDTPDMSIAASAKRLAEDFEAKNGYKPEPVGERWV